MVEESGPNDVVREQITDEVKVGMMLSGRGVH